VDLAGLVRGASHGQGLGNQFLAAIREVDAVLQVVRCFADAQVPHVEGSVDPLRDLEIIELELILADLASVERRQEKLRSALKGHDKDAEREASALARLADHLSAQRPASALPDEQALGEAAQLHLLTAKPQVLLANIGERPGEAEEALARLKERWQGPMIAVPGKLEAELADLSEEERALFAPEMGSSGDGLERVVRACYQALDLVTFYTGVGAEARGWPVRRGTALAPAAGRIHSDMERGFIRAEVVSFEALDRAGSWQEAHRVGVVRTEGHDYQVQEGDVVLVRFHV